MFQQLPNLPTMNKGAYSLLTILTDGCFHSGEDIARKLGVTRTSVWKSIKQLESYGLTVNAVRGKGYCLDDAIELLSEKIIKSNLLPVIKNELSLEVLLNTTSTNSHLLERLENESIYKHVVIAETQSNGRGRRGNKWLSPLAGGIYFSIAWHFDRPFSDLSLLSLYIGVAIARSLKSIGVETVKLKWPNDIVIDYKKLGGVLIDMRGEADGPLDVVIGVGVNYKYTEKIANEIDQNITNISSHINHKLSRNGVIASLLNHIFDVMSKIESSNTSGLINEWREYDSFINKSAQLVSNKNIIKGKVKGVDDQGALLMLVDDEIQRFTSGEISLRKQA